MKTIQRFFAPIPRFVQLFPGLLLAAAGISCQEMLPAQNLRGAASTGEITYPTVTLQQGDQTTHLAFALDQTADKPGLRLVATATGASRTVSARIIRENGKIEEPASGFAGGTNYAGGLASRLDFYFPPGPNALNAAWIDVALSDRHYLLEVPYGIDRDTTAALPLPNLDGPVRLPARVAGVLTNVETIHWEKATYAIGTIQNSWMLWLIESNPRVVSPETPTGVAAKLIFHREPGSAPWSVHSPITDLTYLDEKQGFLSTRGVSIILNGDTGRTDSFITGYFRPGESDVRRTWGRIEIKVDDKTYRLIVPSSLYRFNHGIGAIPLDSRT